MLPADLPLHPSGAVSVMRVVRFGDGARGRSAAVKRVLRLWQLLDGRRYLPPLSHLATELGVTTRTVRRDIAVLEELYFRVPQKLPCRYFSALGGEVSRNNAAARARK